MASVIANGIQIEYESFGDRARPAVMLVRGRGSQLIDWPESLTQGLVDRGFFVVAHDNRDSGLSEKVEGDYSLDDMATDLAALMDTLEIPRASVFGISLGGAIAQVFAYLYPEKLACLFPTMTSSGAPGLPYPEASVVERLFTFGEDRASAIAEEMKTRELFASPAYPVSEAERLKSVERGYDRCYEPDAFRRQSSAAMASSDRHERIAEIAAPTLVMHGSADPIVFVEHGKDLAHRIPNAELLIIDGLGHEVPFGVGAYLADKIADFCVKHDPQTTA